ncbi:MAG: DUF4268 domain-containing protein [Bacteroidetes bacterium]|nr:DUF4268 domain-containing protein [Bacteroidota bacterium]
MKLGKLEKVNLRDQWRNEAIDFTPWLAQEENINILSEAISMDLEVVSQEESVGPFRADILCKDGTDKYVLIENQIELTDHKHLGQIITYAAGLEAVSIIWIASRFTDEHRAAIDWLNHITQENFNFFGIEIELYKIGDSTAAPMFNVVAKPNDWSKIVKRSAEPGKFTETDTFRLQYWTAMKEFIESHGRQSYRLQNPYAQHWTNVSLGRSGVHLAATVSKKYGWIRIELVFDGPSAKEQYNLIKDQYGLDAAGQFSEKLEWFEVPGTKACSAFIKKTADTTDISKWSEQHEWFRVNLEKFYTYFSPKIKAL